MSTMPTSTASAISAAGTRKSLLPPPLAAGCGDALPGADGLATATVDRVGDAVAVGAALVGAADVGAALVAAAVREAVALGEALGTAVVTGDGLGLAALLGGGDGDAVLVPSDAHARESLTPGADAHTDRADVTHDVPSAAVRESATRMKG